MSNYKLLGVGNNAKTVKGDGSEYLTAIMYLAPADTVAGFNLCPMAVMAGCKNGCLYTAGRGAMNSVQQSRIRKTVMLRDTPELFFNILRADLSKFRRYCEKRGIQPVVRLNGTSDYNFLDIVREFPAIQFYDYSKVFNRTAKALPDNYHLTLSYSEADSDYAALVREYADKYDTNMAVVFRDAASIPETFLGRPVINGDADDLRFLDPTGVVVALYAKGKARHDDTGFVIDVTA